MEAVHALDSTKKADLLNKNLSNERNNPLKVFIQVNTSHETNKNGLICNSNDIITLAKHVIENCDKLELSGLMTIGSFATSNDESNENEDFKRLMDERNRLNEILNVDLKLSMGMSLDYVHALKMGSDFVRVGSKLFGQRFQKHEIKQTSN